MFKLHRPSSKKLADRIDFKVSNLQALQVPRGWDKLLVSVVSVETGRALVKSGKASVRNGSCQWTETLSESISIPQNDINKDMGDPAIRLVVAMGSGRFGILGDVTINLANYRGSKTAIPVSLPLKKCNHGTILQFKIHCLLPRTKSREEQLEDTGLPAEDVNVDYDDIENKSDVSDSSYTRSVGSSSSSHVDQTGELNNQDQSFSASGSRYSFDSMEGSLGMENSSPQRNSTGTADNQIGRQDSTGSQNNFPSGSYSFNDSSRSNHSSFNSKASLPRSHVQNQRDDFNHVSRSVRNSVSSKDLMDAAEAKIEELQAEAKMWERKSRQLMTDLETVQKELSEQSEHQTSLEMNLSESRRECDGLKQKIEELKITLEESMEKQRANEDSKFEAKEMNNVQRELEHEVKYLRESNANLDIQLKKTQESNIELVSILQELEDTIEKQKAEIENLSKLHAENENAEKSFCGHEENDKKKATSYDPEADQLGASEPENMNVQLEELGFHLLQKHSEKTIQVLEDPTDVDIYRIEADQSQRNKALEDREVEWKEKLAAKEGEIISLEAKLSEALKSHHSRNEESKDLISEIEVLNQKIEELERDCDELTEENLELLQKLKQSKGEIPISGASFNSLPYDISENDSCFAPESEVTKLKTLISSLEEEMRRKEILFEKLSNDCQLVQHHELVKNCADLERQLQDSKEKMCCLNGEVSKYRGKAEGLEVEVAALQQKLACQPERTTETIVEDLKISDVHAAAEVAKTLSNLHEQIQLCLVNVKKYNPSLLQNSHFNDHSNPSQIFYATKFENQKGQAEAILKTFLHLKDLVEVEVATCNGESLEGEATSLRMASNDNLNELEAHNLEDCILSSCDQVQGSLQKNSEFEVKDPDEKVTEKASEVEKLQSENFCKEREIKALRDSQRELEAQISDIRSEKRQLEESMQVLLKEGKMSSECTDDIQNQILVLNSNMDSQVSANKILVRKSSELESSKQELENHLSELEKENLQLSERICGLEAQVRYLTDKRESSRLELQNSETCTMNLQEEIQKLQNELEGQKVDMKQKLQDIQKKWLESQEECDHLMISNRKLQTTAESLIEESSTLQKSNIELRNQKMDLFERYAVVEAELRESKTLFSSMLTKVRTLEEKYTAMMEEVDSKEKALGLELEALIQDNQKHKDVLVLQENLLNQIYSEKSVEVDKLQREIAHLIEQISATHDEDQRTNPDAILEISRLRADKAMLESSLEELQEKLQLSQRTLGILQSETETKLQAIRDELATSRQNQEVLTADNEKLLNLVEDAKSKEEKHKGIVRGLELKLKTSEYERLQVAEEVCSLKEQLQKIPLLQNEIEALRRTLDEVAFDNQRLGASLQIVSADYEELKAEKILSMQKILDLEKSVSELDDCKQSKIALEEKVLRLEGDLTAKEALGAEIAELKNKIARIKREKSEIQRKMKCIVEEKQEYLKRAQSFEEELKQRNDDKQDNHEPPNETSNHNETKFWQIDAKTSATAEPRLDLMSKIQLLENELTEALEANEMYKSQLKSMLSDTCKDEDASAKGYRSRSKSLDSQLKDLEERYFQMSLKYAEVENEREQLALKLKATNRERRWFS